jgi:hypothetical protein
MPWTTPPGAGATVFIWSGYLLAERDRRWQAVRENAGKAGFGCILIPLGNGVDGRYMTQLRCSATISSSATAGRRSLSLTADPAMSGCRSLGRPAENGQSR